MLAVIRQRKIWFILSGTLVIASIVASLFLGLNLGIDFTGGSLLELEFSIARPTPQQVTEALSPLELGSVVAQPIGERGMTLRFKNTDEPTHQQIIETLKRFCASIPGQWSGRWNQIFFPPIPWLHK